MNLFLMPRPTVGARVPQIRESPLFSRSLQADWICSEKLEDSMRGTVSGTVSVCDPGEFDLRAVYLCVLDENRPPHCQCKLAGWSVVIVLQMSVRH